MIFDALWMLVGWGRRFQFEFVHAEAWIYDLVAELGIDGSGITARVCAGV